jgi:catechol 2,3-dioxygenase-like lactoylglutathione lyase family enzyme
MKRVHTTRRLYVVGIAFLLACSLAAQSHRPVEGIDSIVMSVADIDRSVDFYTHVLSFEKLSDVEVAGADYERLEGVFGARARVIRMRLGDEYIELHEFLVPRGRAIPADSRSNDLWFQHVAIVVRDIDEAYRWLRQNKVEHASSGPQRLPDWNPNASGISAFYFKDPDGHPLEILQFPAGKGDPKWQRKTEKLFLGIDHTAIAVSSTDRSLGFYRDLLGMRVAGESENYGTEQEHLNNVFGARLRITALRAVSGPGIELLEYLSPRTGRPNPTDMQANDIVQTETRMTASNIADDEKQLFAARTVFISPGAVSLGGSELDFPQAMTVRDPDGHALQLIAPRH